MRPVRAVALAVVPMLAFPGGKSVPPSACSLLTVSEASTLVGSPVTNVPDDNSETSCGYGTNGGVFGAGVEITVGVFPDATTAHTQFLPWNAIDPPLPPTETVITTSGVGDEAAITHTTPSELSAIDLRKGATLVRLGVHPAASDPALKAAGVTIASRL